MNPATVSGQSRLEQLSEGIPRPFWALLFGTFITKAGSFVMPLLFVYLTQARGLSLPLAGAITSLYGLGSLGGSLIGGVMADRFGRRFTMLTSLLVGAVFLLMLGLALFVPGGMVYAAGLASVLGAILTIGPYLVGAYAAFTEDFLYGMLYLVIPLYTAYYIMSRFDGLRNWVILGGIGLGLSMVGGAMLAAGVSS